MANTETMPAAVPQGFEAFDVPGFDALIGPIYMREDAQGVTIGLRLGEKHGNIRNNPHGGLMAALADIGLSRALARELDMTKGSFVTVSLNLDYAGTAEIGQWIELHGEVQKATGQILFANGYITCAGRRLVHASGIFKRLSYPDPAAGRPR